jgi:hypothetical protein
MHILFANWAPGDGSRREQTRRVLEIELCPCKSWREAARRGAEARSTACRSGRSKRVVDMLMGSLYITAFMNELLEE